MAKIPLLSDVERNVLVSKCRLLSETGEFSCVAIRNAGPTSLELKLISILPRNTKCRSKLTYQVRKSVKPTKTL